MPGGDRETEPGSFLRLGRRLALVTLALAVTTGAAPVDHGSRGVLIAETFWTAERSHALRVGAMLEAGDHLPDHDEGVMVSFSKAAEDLQGAPADVKVFTMLAFTQSFYMAREPKLRDYITGQGKAVIPTLLSLLNETADTHLGYLHNDGYHSFNIGRVSFQLLETIIEPGAQNLRSRRDADGRWIPRVGYLEHFDEAQEHPDIDADALAAWWRANRHLTLRELRIQALRWRLESERSKGFADDEEARYVLGRYEHQLAALVGG